MFYTSCASGLCLTPPSIPTGWLSSHVEIKSKFEHEFRRFSIKRAPKPTFEEFKTLIKTLHHIEDIPFLISYTDPEDGDLLPINNDDNLRLALKNARSLLRVFLKRKGNSHSQVDLNGSTNKSRISSLLTPRQNKTHQPLTISNPKDFRQVAGIIDVDIVPKTCRRVKLVKPQNSEKPLGFYIRDGNSTRVTPHGLEKVPGVFISRLVPGGLAESTGLLRVHDEVLEVNGIKVAEKSLEKITDMMIANSSNLIITARTTDHQHLTPRTRQGSRARTSKISAGSNLAAGSQQSGFDNDRYDNVDEICDLTLKQLEDETLSSNLGVDKLYISEAVYV